MAPGRRRRDAIDATHMRATRVSRYITQAEAEKLKEAGRKLKERERKAREEEEARAKLEAEAAAEADRAKREAELKKLECRQKRLAREKRRDDDRSESRLRSPICCIMGHVDTGKTKLLDKIRQTNVQDGEAGGITQQIGATFFDDATLKEKIRPVAAHLASIKDQSSSYVDAILGPDPDAPRLTLPGLLVIDTPGHESFSNLRSRGSSLCDMAILVVDLMHGLEPQTLESISMLKRKRTPFVVALNKVDRCYDWSPTEGASIREALAKQAQNTLDEFEQKKANAFTELNEQSLNVALYWDNDDPGSTVSVVPTSAITGEGVPDLLRVVLSLTQQRLAAKLMFGYNLQCTVLEVKVVEGLGATLDVILVNGCLHAGDTMVLCTQDGPIVTTARALLTPPPSRETRVKSELIKHESLEGAIGLKITGDPELTKVVPGTGILVMHQDDDVEDLKVRHTAWISLRHRRASSGGRRDGVRSLAPTPSPRRRRRDAVRAYASRERTLYMCHAGGVHEGHRQSLRYVSDGSEGRYRAGFHARCARSLARVPAKPRER